LSLLQPPQEGIPERKKAKGEPAAAGDTFSYLLPPKKASSRWRPSSKLKVFIS